MNVNAEFFDNDYPALVKELERYLGSAAIDKKIKRTEHSLARANPLVAAYYGAPPNAALWLGLKKARQAVNRRARVPVRDIEVRRAVDLAATLRILWQATPQWKRNEVRARLLSDGALEPVILELKTALDLVLSGHNLTWIESSSTAGVRVPDMLAEKDGFAFEVECKAESADEGRKVARAAMHEFCYRLAAQVIGDKIEGLWRDVSVRVPDRFPANHTWQDDLVRKIKAIKNGGTVELADGTSSKVVLRLAPNHLPSFVPGQFCHVCVLTARSDGSEPALTIRCSSAQPDTMLAAIEEDLKDALGQFSGNRPGKIVCYVPEVPSFRGLNTTDAGIVQMTHHFFAKHRRAGSVFEIDYLSDTDLQSGQAFASRIHFLRLQNPSYEHASSIPQAPSSTPG